MRVVVIALYVVGFYVEIRWEVRIFGHGEMMLVRGQGASKLSKNLRDQGNTLRCVFGRVRIRAVAASILGPRRA